jgi:hypothetical protein
MHLLLGDNLQVAPAGTVIDLNEGEAFPVPPGPDPAFYLGDPGLAGRGFEYILDQHPAFLLLAIK